MVIKRIAITMGDPGGIGPEVVLKALASPGVKCMPVVVGDMSVLKRAVRLLEIPVVLKAVKRPADTDPGIVQVIDVGRFGGHERSSPTKEGGGASFAFIEKAVGLAMRGEVRSIVTAPISKEALNRAGRHWPGHTEMLAELTGTSDYGMMLMGGSRKGRRLRVMLATIHKAIRDVPDLITRETVLKSIRLAGLACEMLLIREPKIAVSALNPHAGEAGLFGDEEIRVISPAVSEAVSMGLPVSGPYPPDTVYHRAYRGEFDIVVSMYHDQGLIPLKLAAFDRGVNVTVGLPFVRTSPDHGTAYDIAWTGRANPGSMREAIRAAVNLREIKK
jgi:4-hydroxythreonine-4-phosphate dehydrogenase